MHLLPISWFSSASNFITEYMMTTPPQIIYQYLEVGTTLHYTTIKSNGTKILLHSQTITCRDISSHAEREGIRIAMGCISYRYSMRVEKIDRRAATFVGDILFPIYTRIESLKVVLDLWLFTFIMVTERV